jgi:aminodeoxyfutalosine synthase
MLPPDVLDEARKQIEHNQRIGYELASSLLTKASLSQLGDIADLARRRRIGDKVYFVSNYHLYYTNVCVWGCKFCAFSRRPGEAGAYTKTIDDIADELSRLNPDISEIRITGGVNPKLNLAYYETLLCLIKSKLPEVHIEAFAPTEIDFISQRSGLSVAGVLTKLRDAGLGSLTSGGAEIFNPRLRERLCSNKTSIRSWQNISKIAHSMGIASNASILFGHLETYDDWLEHLLALRRLQDETGGFNSFIPLRFLPKNTEMASFAPVDFSEVLKMIAISRIMLDNFKYIKFLWLYYGKQRITEALSHGSNDLAGTANEQYKGVARSAESGSCAYIAKQELVNIIKECQRLPVERGRLYQEKHVYH